jgi:hypothetical protein
MSNPKFKVGQVVSYRSATSTLRARKGGIITKVEKMYELKDKNKRYYPNGVCRGELTTIKKLSKGKAVGYAYRTNSIQPKGYAMDITTIEEDNLKLSSKQSILNSYNIYS